MVFGFHKRHHVAEHGTSTRSFVILSTLLPTQSFIGISIKHIFYYKANWRSPWSYICRANNAFIFKMLQKNPLLLLVLLLQHSFFLWVFHNTPDNFSEYLNYFLVINKLDAGKVKAESSLICHHDCQHEFSLRNYPLLLKLTKFLHNPIACLLADVASTTPPNTDKLSPVQAPPAPGSHYVRYANFRGCLVWMSWLCDWRVTWESQIHHTQLFDGLTRLLLNITVIKRNVLNY